MTPLNLKVMANMANNIYKKLSQMQLVKKGRSQSLLLTVISIVTNSQSFLLIMISLRLKNLDKLLRLSSHSLLLLVLSILWEMELSLQLTASTKQELILESSLATIKNRLLQLHVKLVLLKKEVKMVSSPEPSSEPNSWS